MSRALSCLATFPSTVERKKLKSGNNEIVIESSSTWYHVYELLSEDERNHVILSNPVKTKAIASAKVKTDKIDALTLAESKVVSRPRWWRPLWAFCALATLVLALISYFYAWVGLGNVVGGAALAFVGISFAYYIRIRPNVKVNRAIYIFLGVTPIGFLLWIVEAIILSRFFVISSIGWPLFLTVSVIPSVIGTFIGDWIGKRRDYQLPLSP